MRSSGQEGTSPWKQRGFVAAAGLVGAVAAAGAVLLVGGTGAGEPAAVAAAPAAVPAAPEPAAPEPVAAQQSSACGLPDGPQEVPYAAPAGGRWELVGRTAAPTAPGLFGPERTTDALRSCYAHSPTGALHAAAGAFAATGVPAMVEPLVRELTAAGPGRDAALRRLAAEGLGSGESSDGGAQVAGFDVVDYAGSSATVDLAFRVVTGDGRSGYVSWPVDLRWEDGDWKLVLDPDGGFPRPQQLPGLAGYTPWAGA